MSDSYPHVARRRDRIEPAGDCTYDEAQKRLRLLTPLLEVLGVALNRPGLLSPLAIDSIGTLLCPPAKGPMAAANPLAERYRSLLVDRPLLEAGSTSLYPRVRLQLRTHETVSVESAELLDPRARLSCLAIRGTDEMARRLDPQERALSDLTVELDECGTTLVVRQQKNPQRVVVVLTPSAKTKSAPGERPKRNVLEATLTPAQRSVLSDLFEGSGKGRLGQLRPEPIDAVYMPPYVPKSVSTKTDTKTTKPPPPPGNGYHLMPTWMTEHLGQVAQDLFRLHALSTAAVHGRARMLYLDRASVHRNDDPRFFKDNFHTLIRCALHTASSACVCGLHGKAATTPFRLLEFRIEMCGAAFVERNGRRCCPRHCGERAHAQESALFQGVCTRSLKVELWCCHERKPVSQGAKPPSASEGGVRIAMTGLLENATDDLKKPAPGAWMLDSVRELAACACVLAKPASHNPALALELKADADGVTSALERECHSRGHVDARLGEIDETAVWLLRRGGGAYNRRSQKIEMANKRKLPGDPPSVALTHGHLFKLQK